MQLITLPTDAPHMPTLGEFAAQWVLDMEPQWKASYRETVACTLRLWIVPTFGHWPLDRIDRSSLMAYRAAVSAHPRKPSAARVNKIMMILGALLGEAGRRHGLADPLEDVKPLRERHRDIQPFSLDEVNRILLHATPRPTGATTTPCASSPACAPGRSMACSGSMSTGRDARC